MWSQFAVNLYINTYSLTANVLKALRLFRLPNLLLLVSQLPWVCFWTACFLLHVNEVTDVFKDLSVALSLFADDLKLCISYKVNAPQDDV